MNRKLIVGSILAEGLLCALIGYSLGRIPTSQELSQAQKQQVATQDFMVVANKSLDLYQLCEQKYQFGINGQFDNAYEVKGEMNALLRDIQVVLDKQKGKTL